MDAGTYPNETVADFINQNVIALRIAADSQPFADDFDIKWTPALLVLDKDGKEHHRTIGFFDADQLIPSISLGMGKVHFNNNQFEQALNRFEMLLTEYAQSDAAPETIFWAAVSKYKHTNDPMPLREAYDHLKESCPASQWTNRAYPYRLIG